MSLNRTSPELCMSRSREVKMYPTEPLSDGIAFIEYEVLNRALGDLDTDKCSPLGTVKSRIAAIESCCVRSDALVARTLFSGAYHWMTVSSLRTGCPRSSQSPDNSS